MVVIICVAVNIVKLLENRRDMGEAEWLEGLTFIRTKKEEHSD